MISQHRLILISITLFVGAGSTLWGLSQMSLPNASLITWDTVYPYIAALAIGVAIVEGFARWLSFGRLTAGAAVIGLFSILTGTVWPLFVSVWFLTASYVLGLGILFVFGIDKEKTTGLITFLTGAGAYGTAAGLLAHFPINYPGLYGAALAIPIIFGWRSIDNSVSSYKKYLYQPTEFRWLDIAIALIALVHFSIALMPELGHDALAMHLAIPSHLLHRHEWAFDVDSYVWAVMPMMGDWIYSFAYMLGGETAARIINVGFIYILSLLLRDLVLWAGGNEWGARWAILIFLVTPLTYTETSSLHIESVWASFIVAGSFLILKMLSTGTGQKSYLLLTAICLGSALASKAVTFTVLPVLLLLLLFRYHVWCRAQFTLTIFLSLMIFFAIGAYPYITAWAITGNPVFPFFNEYFQAPQYPAVNFSAPAIFEKGVSWDTIYRITFDSGKYLESKPGAGGFQWLLLLLPSAVLLITTMNRKGLVLIFVGVLAIVFTFHQTAYLRYILPSYVILGAVIGVAVSVILSGKNILLRRSVIIISMATVLLNAMFIKSGTYYGDIVPQALMSDAGRIEYLQRRLPIRNAVDLVNKLNINKSPVAAFSPPLTAGLYSDVLYPSWYNHKFRSLIQGADDANAIADALLNKGVEFIILDRNWNNPEKSLIIKKSTRVVADFGNITVRVLKERYLFNTELLQDSEFSMKNVWNFSKATRNENGGVIVSVESPVTQTVPVVSGRKYLLTVDASCIKEASQGRLQVNWLDAKSKFINTNINVFRCTQTPDSHSMEVVAPNGAFKAVIYATGHTIKPLIINKVSFKK